MKTYEIKLDFKCVCEGASTKAPKLETPDLVASYMRDAFNEYPEQEQFWVVHLNRKNRARGRQLVTLGTQNSSLVHPREVYRAAIVAGAAAIVCVHNHPSGDPSPSSADITVTRQLREAAKTIGIELLDHVIVGEKGEDPSGLGYYSFRSAGLI